MSYQKRWTRNSISIGYEKFNDLYNAPPSTMSDQYKYKWFTGPRLSFSMPQRKLFGAGDKIKNDIYISYGLTYTDGKNTHTKDSCLDQDYDGLCDCEVKCSFFEDDINCIGIDEEFISDCYWDEMESRCINIDDDGTVSVSSSDKEKLDIAITQIKAITEDPKVGSVFDGKVTKTLDFGAFVEFAPGREGLVHISHLDWKRVDKVRDVVSVGDKVKVKLFEIDKQGRLNFSMKLLKDKPK